MSGHSANPVFFNKKSKDWTSRTFATPPLLPHPPTSDNISFLSYPPLLQGGRHMFITPYLKITKFFRIHRTVKKYSNNIRIFIMHDLNKFFRIYTFPKSIFRNHMSHENEAILRKSISDERK